MKKADYLIFLNFSTLEKIWKGCDGITVLVSVSVTIIIKISEKGKS